MNRLWKFAALAAKLFLIADISSGNDSEPLRIVVMDPLALPLSCACVDGTGQRRYERLAYFLEKQIGQTVEVIFEESLALAIKRSGANVDLIIGKKSMVEFDAALMKKDIHALAALSGRDGGTDVRGVILVRKDSPAKTIGDLAGRKVVLGPEEDAESNGAARVLLKSSGAIISVAGSMDSAALALSDGEADAAVISSFLPPLFEGCGKITPDSLRNLAETEAVPFITVFATDSLDETKKALIQKSLLLVAKDPDLLEALESKNGFVLLPGTSSNWPDWRGPDRRGFSPDIPESLPPNLKQIWKIELTGPDVSGPTATEKYVVIPDKSTDDEFDLFRCFDALTGKQIWKIEYEASGEMDYSNSPRATPVIHETDGVVYLQGAFGDLTCADLETGELIWELNLFIDFAAETLTWGSSSPPLIVGDQLIINPGAEDASIVALDRHTGETIWKAPGSAAAYSAFIFATINSTPQIIGYDSGSLGGWNPENGKRLWTLVPPSLDLSSTECQRFQCNNPAYHRRKQYPFGNGKQRSPPLSL